MKQFGNSDGIFNRENFFGFKRNYNLLYILCYYISDSIFQVVSDCGISRVLPRVLQVGKISDDKQPAGWNYDKYLLQHHQAGLYQHALIGFNWIKEIQ